MDLSVMHAILGVVAIVLGVIVRLGVYTVLVKFNRWLPEKATKIANASAAVVTLIGICAVACNWFFAGR